MDPPARAALSLLAVAAAGCWGGPDGYVRRIEALHDAKTFAHVPDVPDTWEECAEEVVGLAEEEYDDAREAAGAVLVLTRVAIEDRASLHRLEACRALGILGLRLRDFGEASDAPSPTEEELEAAVTGGLFRTAGEFRIPLPAEPGDAGYGRELGLLRRALYRVRAAPPGEEADLALARLGVQVVRFALAGSLHLDRDRRVRAEAAEAIGIVGGEGLVEVLAAAYGHETDAVVRGRMLKAATGLAVREGGTARERAFHLLLLALTEDDDRGTRYVAREGLGFLAGEDLGEKAAPWRRWWEGTKAGP